MKYLLFIGDGMADEALPELENQSPIEYAHTPTIDALAKKGIVGSVENCPRELRAGSDTAILSIFGCDPRRYYTGRASLEAAALGISLPSGAVAYRCNMVSLTAGDMPFEEKCLLSHSAGSISGDVSDALLADLLRDGAFSACARHLGISFTAGHSFRHVAVQQESGELPALISPSDHQGQKIGGILPKNSGLTELMRLANAFLEKHPINAERIAAGLSPANGIWLWAAGKAAALPKFAKTYGMTGTVVSAVPLCKGIASLVGLEAPDVPGATGELDSDLEAKVAAVLKALERHNFAALHVEIPDECTHNGDLAGKVQSIEWLDSRCMAPLVKAFAERGWEYRILFLSDHFTLRRTRGHAHGAVPFLLYDSRRDSSRGLSYNEKNGRKGPYYESGADSLLKLLFEL